MRLYCSNCNKYGHINKSCDKPITSIGMIIIKIDSKIKKNILNNIDVANFEDINNFNYQRISNLKNIDFYKDKIEFLLIEKKHSLNYIEFVRGLYDVNDKMKLEKMFKLMSQNEINNIKKKNFNLLWSELWNETANKKIYQKEFKKSYNSFKKLIESRKLDELLIINSKYKSPEWEFPKGKKDYNESDLNCAIREINEETTLKDSDYLVLDKISKIQDIFIGTNNLNYKHIYFLSILKNDKNFKIENNKEVNNIKFVKIDKITEYIRDYDFNKLNIITKVFLFIMNICEEKKNLLCLKRC